MTHGQLPDPVFVEINGVTVATYEFTPDIPSRGPDVVMCHGTPWSAEVWAPVAARLGATRRVLLWDMPGYGRSEQGAHLHVDLNTQTSRFAQLLDHWQSTKPHVVAHDVGGAVALGGHLMNCASFASLFLWDAVVLEPWGSAFFRLVADHGEVFAQLPAALHAALLGEYIAGAANHRLGSDELRRLTSPWTGERGQSAFYQQIGALHEEHTRPLARRLPEVNCPTAIGWGADDPWVPASQADRLQRLLPGNRPVTMLEAVGHLAPIEDPKRVHRTIEVWLRNNTTRNHPVE